jgi:hypothetical protein
MQDKKAEEATGKQRTEPLEKSSGLPRVTTETAGKQASSACIGPAANAGTLAAGLVT